MMQRERDAQARALAAFDRQKLTKKIVDVVFELPDGCNGCRYRSDNCAAGETVDIQDETVAFGNDRDGLNNREVNKLISRVDAVSWLVHQAVNCRLAIEDGKHPIAIDLEEKIEQTHIENQLAKNSYFNIF